MSEDRRKDLLPKNIKEPLPPPIVVQAPKNIPVKPPVIKTPKSASVPPPVVKTPKSASVPPSVIVATRICDCCKKDISEEAVKCPFCKEWRRDIKKDVANSRIGIIMIIFCSFAIFLTCISVWPKEKYWTWFSNGPNNCPWHEKVIDKELKKTISPSNDIMSTMVIDIMNTVGEGTLRYRWKFSISKFLTSLSGWFIIVQFIAFILATYTFLSGFNNLKRIGYKL